MTDDIKGETERGLNTDGDLNLSNRSLEEEQNDLNLKKKDSKLPDEFATV